MSTNSEVLETLKSGRNLEVNVQVEIKVDVKMDVYPPKWKLVKFFEKIFWQSQGEGAEKPLFLFKYVTTTDQG